MELGFCIGRNERNKMMGTETGKLIRKMRELLGLSQLDAAKEIGFSNVFLGRIELGKCELPFKHVDKVASVLKLHKEDLVGAIKSDVMHKIEERYKC